MRDGFYRQTRRVEDLHWWFVYRRRLVDALLESEGVSPAGGSARALDLGCGTGGNLAAIERLGYWPLGADRSPLALALARTARPGAVLLRSDAQRIDACLRPAVFDLVTVFNVLYHAWIADERRVLEGVRTVLRPGGWLLLTEPALGFLRRRHDEVDLGVRRYTLGRLRRLVEESGFSVVRATYFNTLALPAATAVALLDRVRGKRGEAFLEETGEVAIPPDPVNRALLALCSLELACIRRLGRVPLGVGALLLARNGAGKRVETDQVGTYSSR